MVIEWSAIQTRQVILEVLTEGPHEPAAIAYRAKGLTTSMVREQLAVMVEQSLVHCLTRHNPPVWALTKPGDVLPLRPSPMQREIPKAA